MTHVGSKRSSMSPFTSAAASFPRDFTFKALLYSRAGLSNLSPIDHSSRRGHKSRRPPLQMATSKHCQLHNTNRMWAEKKNKAPNSLSCEKVFAAVNPVRSQLPDLEFFCPPVAPLVCQMCAPPNCHPPACDLRRAWGRILGNFSLTSYTVDCGVFLR